MFPKLLSILQQRFEFRHNKLSHIYPKSMFRLSKIVVFPSIFLDLKDGVHLCASWIFGKARKNKLRIKGNKLGFIRKETDNNPVAEVSLDQLKSIQTWYVPRLQGKLSITRSWDAQVVVVHFNYLTYVYLIKIKIQEGKLAVKLTFERWVATFENWINRNHA